MTSFEKSVAVSSMTNMEFKEFGDDSFSTTTSEQIVGIFDISGYRRASITAYNTDATNAVTVKVYVSNQKAQPSSTLATMQAQCDEISGGGQSVAAGTTVDIMFAVNSIVATNTLNNARWCVITATAAAGTPAVYKAGIAKA